MKNVILIVAILMLISGCRPNTIQPSFEGNWKGTYTGTGDNGSWEVVITSAGAVSGSATSITFSQTYSAVGTVTGNGQISITFGTASSGAVFQGTLSGNSGSGTWVNNSRTPPYTGSWSGKKQ